MAIDSLARFTKMAHFMPQLISPAPPREGFGGCTACPEISFRTEIPGSHQKLQRPTMPATLAWSRDTNYSELPLLSPPSEYRYRRPSYCHLPLLSLPEFAAYNADA